MTSERHRPLRLGTRGSPLALVNLVVHSGKDLPTAPVPSPNVASWPRSASAAARRSALWPS